MANKPTRHIKVATPKPPTEEEMMSKRLAYFAQRREQISLAILCSLLQNNPGVNGEDVIIKALDIADGFLEKLYPVKPEDKKPKEEEETPVMKNREKIRKEFGLLEDSCASEQCAYRGKNVCTCRKGIDICPMYIPKEDKK